MKGGYKLSIPETVSSLSLEGKKAIVTGGGTGIGRSIALEFARAGADVAISGRRVAPLEEVAKEVEALGRRSLAVQADVSKKADVDNMVSKTLDRFGAIDILVNNAANHGSGPSLLDSEEDRWDEIIDTNLKGVYLCCRAVAKGMIERNSGNIINIASIDGVRPATSCRIYGVAKSGVIFITRGLALDLGAHNIRVNTISPGAIQTDMISEVWSNPETLKQLESTLLLRRIGQPIDIGSAALFLASDASNYITGQNLVVDAGAASVARPSGVVAAVQGR